MNLISIGIFLIVLALFYFLKKYLEKSEKKMEEAFKALSFEVMEKSTKSLLDIAKSSLGSYQENAKDDLVNKKNEIESLIKPMKEAISSLDIQGKELEKKRELAYLSIKHQIDAMIHSENALKKQTEHLAKALTSPNIRGTWGQIHLKRVVELCGLLNSCDFFEQETLDNQKRPDMVIHLPGQKKIAIDAKTPLDAYLESMEAPTEQQRVAKLHDHATQIQRHVKDLGSKEYWKQFDSSPEYVILFLPAEAFFSAALQVDPLLIERGVDKNVLIATPTTLIAILRAVALSWKQESLSQSAKEIADLGKELYSRMATLSDHWSKVGKSLGQSMDAYNQATASLQTRVLSSAKKLKEMGASLQEKEVKEVIELDKTIKQENLLL